MGGHKSWKISGEHRDRLMARCRARVFTLHGLVALRHDRAKAPWLLDSPINGQHLRTSVKTLQVPTFSPGGIIIMDNLGAHESSAIRQAKTKMPYHKPSQGYSKPSNQAQYSSELIRKVQPRRLKFLARIKAKWFSSEEKHSAHATTTLGLNHKKKPRRILSGVCWSAEAVSPISPCRDLP